MKEVRAVFSGIVQGVGFRWQVLHYAKQRSLVGTVKNLEDGSVEVIAQGSNLEEFVHAIQDHPGAGTITDTKTKYYDADLQFSEFRIIS